jgi:hypothetical protein
VAELDLLRHGACQPGMVWLMIGLTLFRMNVFATSPGNMISSMDWRRARLLIM